MSRFSNGLFCLLFVAASINAKPRSILCIGDSLTLGASKPSFVVGGYRGILQSLLTEAGSPVEFVGSRTDNSEGMASPRHEGWPGYRIEQIEAAALPTLIKDRADIVLLLAGTNDVRQGFVLAEAPARLEVLITLIAKLQPQAAIFVGSLPLLLFDPKHEHQTEARQAFNRSIPDIITRCATRGLHVELVDVRETLASADICSDTVHPTFSGYSKLGRAWFTAITASSNLELLSR